MASRYIFDKRDMKKTAKRYGLRLLIAFPFVFLVVLLTSKMNLWASLGLGLLTGLVVLGVIELICYWTGSGKEEENSKDKNKKKNKKNK